jgi:hypothetical protein
MTLILREEHRLGVFGNRELRRIFGLKRKEVEEDREGGYIMRGFAKYCWGKQTEEGETGGAISTHGRNETCINNFSRKTSKEETTRKT